MRITKEQAAIIGAYTGILCGPFEDLQAYASEKLERELYTHHFASKKLWAKLKAAAKEDFMAIAYQPHA